ncbi:MAG: DUF5615 family PIN-like protein [Rhodomicrobium sp.]
MSGETSARTVWVDVQLPPSLAPWLRERYNVSAFSLRDLGLRDAEDIEIFKAARLQNALLISKDGDFVDLVQRLGTPPQLVWVTCGNVINANLKEIFSAVFADALNLLQAGEAVVEISGRTITASA